MNLEENRFSHIYRYAKNWYVKSDNKMEDLKKILNHTYGHDFHSDNDVIDIISHLAFEHIQKSGNPEYQFSNMMQKLNPESWINKLYGAEDLSYRDRLINACLSIIGLCHGDKIDGELAEPDENILPLSESAIKNKEEQNAN